MGQEKQNKEEKIDNFLSGDKQEKKEEKDQKPKCSCGSKFGVVLAIILTAVLVGGGVYYFLNQKFEGEKGGLVTQIKNEKKVTEECKTEKEKLEKEVEENKENKIITKKDVDNWTLVSHENFWNNPELFKSDSYAFPKIRFYYPENWIFACCGDMSHASVHIIYSSGKRDLTLPYVRITDFVLSGCPDFEKVCALDKQVAFSAIEKFSQIKSEVTNENVLPKIKLEKLNVEAFAFQKQERDNDYSMAYLINIGDDVVEIDFVNYNLMDNSFIEAFLNKISYE